MFVIRFSLKKIFEKRKIDYPEEKVDIAMTEICYWLGRLYFKKGHYASAENEFYYALKSYPILGDEPEYLDMAITRLWLGNALQAQGKCEQAKKEYEIALMMYCSMYHNKAYQYTLQQLYPANRQKVDPKIFRIKAKMDSILNFVRFSLNSSYAVKPQLIKKEKTRSRPKLTELTGHPST